MPHQIANPLDQLLDSGITLPPLPAVGVRLLRLARVPIDEIDVRRLAALVDTDPALALRILKLANSPYYSPASEVTSLGQALMLIGPREAIQTLCFFVLSNSMPKLQKLDHFSLDDFWAHSWACATAARMVCHPDNGIHIQPGEMYLAGLLQGVGKLVLAQALPREFDRCLLEARQSGVPLHTVERQNLGYTETELAARLLESWAMPSAIRAVISHCPFPGAASGEFQERAGVLQFAQIVANFSGIGSNGTLGETDPAVAWIVQNGQSPLAGDKLREIVVGEIVAAFQERALSVVGSSVKCGQEAEEGGLVVSARRRRAPERPAAGGLWARFGRIWRSIFG